MRPLILCFILVEFGAAAGIRGPWDGRGTGGFPAPWSTPSKPDTHNPGQNDFNVLEHLGANSPWFPGPNVFGISSETPDGCIVDQAAYVSRHGSRYPDPGAYGGWVALHEKLQAANFTARDELAFLATWKPVLSDPDQQIRQVSPGGYGELYAFGVELRTRYPTFYRYGNPFRLWSNDYERTIDSARLFARGFLGPNSTLGDVYAITASDPSAVGNSLATSDSCPTFEDISGGDYVATWDSIYLPPIAERLSTYIEGDLELTETDVSAFPYLCGFESQITRRVSPFCAVFTQNEIMQYEYRQDLRYFYGTGPGAFNNASVMLPVLQGIVDIFMAGPETSVTIPGNQKDTLGPLTVAFTHDNQINELASILGVFDDQPPLAADSMNETRIYVSSRINPMRGTVAFERLNCSGELYMRLLINDAVYPVPSCSSGPGLACPLQQYNDDVVKRKWEQAGSFASFCDLPTDNVTSSTSGGVTFFTDLTLDAIKVLKP